MSTSESEATARQKVGYVGAPAVFALRLACQHLQQAFPEGTCYLVGSSNERPDWRDVDVVLIIEDDAFERLFPDAVVQSGAFETDPRWLVLTIALSGWLAKETGLPIDFKIQPRTWANSRHGGHRRDAIGMRARRVETSHDHD